MLAVEHCDHQPLAGAVRLPACLAVPFPAWLPTTAALAGLCRASEMILRQLAAGCHETRLLQGAASLTPARPPLHHHHPRRPTRS